MAKRRPWLGRWARTSLAPFTLALVPLATLFMSVLLMRANLDGQIENSKSKLIASCAGAEGTASYAASSPHHVAKSINNATLHAVNETIKFTSQALDVVLDIAEGLVAFAIASINTPLVCFVEFCIRATLNLMIDAAELLDDGIDAATGAFRSSIEGVEDAVNAVIGTINSVGVSVDSIDIDTYSFHDPDLDIASWMYTINSSIPTLGEAEKMLEELFDTPIEVVRTIAIQALANSSRELQFNALPVPATQTVTFCDELDTSFLDDLGAVIWKWSGYAMIALAAVAVLLIAGLMSWQYFNFTFTYRVIAQTRSTWLPDADHKGTLSTERMLGFVQATEHPLVSLALHRMRVRGATLWLASYCCYPPALLFLAIGVLGIALVQVQLYVLQGPLLDEAKAVIGSGLADLESKIVTSVNSSLATTSQQWASKINEQVTIAQDDINTKALGWTNAVTMTLNSTANKMLAEVESSTSDYFSPSDSWGDLVDQLIDCIIGTQAEQVKSAIKWIEDNAQVSLPIVADDRFTLSREQLEDISSGLSGSSAQSALDGLIDRFVNRFVSVLELTRWLFIAYAGIFVIIVLEGLAGFVYSIIMYYARGGRQSHSRKKHRQQQPRTHSRSPWGTVVATWDQWTKGMHLGHQSKRGKSS